MMSSNNHIKLVKHVLERDRVDWPNHHASKHCPLDILQRFINLGNFLYFY